MAAAIETLTPKYGSSETAAQKYLQVLSLLEAKGSDKLKPSIVGASEALNNLKSKMDEGKDVSDVFGAKTINVARYVASMSAAIDENTKKIFDNSNALKQSNIANNSLGTAEAELSNSWTNITSIIGESFLPLWKECVKAVTDILDPIYHLIEALKNNQAVMLVVGGTITILKKAIASIAFIIKIVVGALELLTRFITIGVDTIAGAMIPTIKNWYNKMSQTTAFQTVVKSIKTVIKWVENLIDKVKTAVDWLRKFGKEDTKASTKKTDNPTKDKPVRTIATKNKKTIKGGKSKIKSETSADRLNKAEKQYKQGLIQIQNKYNAGLYTAQERQEAILAAERQYYEVKANEGRLSRQEANSYKSKEQQIKADKILIDSNESMNKLNQEYADGMVETNEYYQKRAEILKRIYEENLKNGTATKEMAENYKQAFDVANQTKFEVGSINELRDQISKIESEINSTSNIKLRAELVIKKSNLQGQLDNILDTTTIKEFKFSSDQQDKYKSRQNAESAINDIQKLYDLKIIDKATAIADIEEINQKLKGLGLEPIKINLDDKAFKDKLSSISDELSSFGSSLSSIGDGFEMPELNVAGTMAQAIATMVNSYAIASERAAALGPIGWFAFAATGIAQLTAIISTMKSVGSYAEGGIIGGGSSNGDFLTAKVNAGEMILNGSQQKKLFKMLNGDANTYNGGEVKFKIEGSTLQGVLNNFNKKWAKQDDLQRLF